jgi:hypothetical protein
MWLRRYGLKKLRKIFASTVPKSKTSHVGDRPWPSTWKAWFLPLDYWGRPHYLRIWISQSGSVTKFIIFELPANPWDMRTSSPGDREGLHPDAPLHPSTLPNTGGERCNRAGQQHHPLPTREGLERLAVTISCYSLGCIPAHPSPTSYLPLSWGRCQEG